MRKHLNYLKNKQFILKLNDNFYDYLWYGYHKLLFGSLILRGQKLTAFNFLSKIYQKLKEKDKKQKKRKTSIFFR